MSSTSGPAADGYAREIYRTRPDFVIYRPAGEFIQGENQHLIVVTAPSGRLLAFWTQSTIENHTDQRVVVAISDDAGVTWEPPTTIDGALPEDPPGTGLASWAFPIVAAALGRIYVFYNKNIGLQDTRADTTGVLRGRYSTDEGRTWSDSFDLPIAPCALSHPDPAIPQSWIVYQAPAIAADGVPVAGFTHWASAQRTGEKDLFRLDSEVRFLRFENLLIEPDVSQLRLTTWPDSPHGLRVPCTGNAGKSVAQEPSIVLLPDGRLFTVLRTLNGWIAWSQSRDNGRTWTPPLELRFHDDGPVVPQPIAPCPVYALDNGRYLLLFHNNPGSANGGSGPSDYLRNRTPAFLAAGRFVPDAAQPLYFDPAVEWMSSGNVALGPCRRTEVATYTSLTRAEGRTILWYPDRKHFLLGRILT